MVMFSCDQCGVCIEEGCRFYVVEEKWIVADESVERFLDDNIHNTKFCTAGCLSRFYSQEAVKWDDVPVKVQGREMQEKLDRMDGKSARR